jgi:DNA-binding transcriptional LysR family regulator
MTEEDFFAAGHVTVAIGNQRTASFGDQMLEALGRSRRIEVVAPSFTMIPWLLIDTHRLAIMHERLARVMAARFAIDHLPLPFSIPLMREMVQYHSTRTSDPGLRWFREQLRATAAEFDPNNL